MSFLKSVRHLFSIFKVDPNTKVEFWNIDVLFGSGEGKGWSKSLRETKLWSEVEDKHRIQSHLGRDYGPDDVLIFGTATIGDEIIEGCSSPDRLQKFYGHITTIQADERDAWIESQKLLEYDYHISLATDVANELVNCFRKEKEDYIASKKAIQSKNIKPEA